MRLPRFLQAMQTPGSNALNGRNHSTLATMTAAVHVGNQCRVSFFKTPSFQWISFESDSSQSQNFFGKVLLGSKWQNHASKTIIQTKKMGDRDSDNNKDKVPVLSYHTGSYQVLARDPYY